MTYKILNIYIYFRIYVLALKFKPTNISYLVDKMLEDKVSMSSLEVVQAISKPSIKKYLTKLQDKLAIETIVIFDKCHLKEKKYKSFIWDAIGCKDSIFIRSWK